MSVILLPAHPASFAHNFVSGMLIFLFQRVPGCNSIVDLSLKKCSGLISLQLDSLIWETASPRSHKLEIVILLSGVCHSMSLSIVIRHQQFDFNNKPSDSTGPNFS